MPLLEPIMVWCVSIVQFRFDVASINAMLLIPASPSAENRKLMQRAAVIAKHLKPAPAAADAKHDDDVVIVSAYRTAITRARKGGFRETQPDAMLAAVLKATVEKTKVDPNKIGDIIVGNVLQGGAGAMTSRMAQLVAWA